MGTKAILDIDINDGKFLAFKKLYDQYAASLKSMPAAWKLVNDKIDGTRSSFDKIVDKMVAQNIQAKLIEKAQERADRLTQSQAERWAQMARSAKSFAGNIKDATVSLLKWVSVTGVISGLAGAGGLFGIDRLALGVGASRRGALGLNVGYGDAKAFSANFSRLVDPESFLSGVAGAKTDVTRRVGLIGAGLTPGEIGGSNADTAVALLKRLKAIADTTDPALFAQTIESRRLGQFVSPEDLQRLRGTSQQEFAGLIGRYGKNKSDFDLPADVSRKWQDFASAMTRAGQGIENTFVRGLAPLTPGLEKLSDSVEKVVRSFLSNPALGEWVRQVGDALERFAGYIGTPEFQKNVESLASGIATLARVVVDAVKWIAGKAPIVSGAASGFKTGIEHSPAAYGITGISKLWEWEADALRGVRKNAGALSSGFAAGVQESPLGQGFSWLRGQAGALSLNNPGNLRPAGQSTGFMSYPTSEAGIAAMARQLLIYQNRDHLDTVSGIVSKYAPAKENNTAAYIGDVSKRARLGPDEKLNLGDRETLARLVAAMVSHENRPGVHDKFKDPKVVLEILNSTGGNVVTSVNGLKQ